MSDTPHDRKLREGRFRVVTANVLATGCSGFLGRHCMEALVRNGLRVHAVTRSPHAMLRTGNLAQSRPARPGRRGGVDCGVCGRPTCFTSPGLPRPAGTAMQPRPRIGWRPASPWSRRSAHVAASVLSAWAVPPNTMSRPVLHGGRNADPPCFPYGQCKAAVWMIIQAYAQRYGFSAAWARVFLPYGPGDDPGALFRPCWPH